jgi:hypothetical protein
LFTIILNFNRWYLIAYYWLIKREYYIVYLCETDAMWWMGPWSGMIRHCMTTFRCLVTAIESLGEAAQIFVSADVWELVPLGSLGQPQFSSPECDCDGTRGSNVIIKSPGSNPWLNIMTLTVLSRVKSRIA